MRDNLDGILTVTPGMRSCIYTDIHTYIHTDTNCYCSGQFLTTCTDFIFVCLLVLFVRHRSFSVYLIYPGFIPDSTTSICLSPGQVVCSFSAGGFGMCETIADNWCSNLSDSWEAHGHSYVVSKWQVRGSVRAGTILALTKQLGSHEYSIKLTMGDATRA